MTSLLAGFIAGLAVGSMAGYRIHRTYYRRLGKIYRALQRRMLG